MSICNSLSVNLHPYVCPQCKHELAWKEQAFHCSACQRDYPILDGIPDFVLENLSKSASPVVRGVKSIDWLARIYESKWWYPFVLNLFGGFGCISFEQLVVVISGLLDTITGRVLDVACGPGTFGRRIATQSKEVYGIDISMGMLRKGVTYVKRDHTPNAHFARAKVEDLPFGDRSFEAAICCGSLHLFVDTVTALREINRTLKPGALLAVFTFTAGTAGILRFHHVREHVRRDHGVHVFEIPEIERYLAEAGFDKFRPKVYGSVLTFSVNKCAECKRNDGQNLSFSNRSK